MDKPPVIKIRLILPGGGIRGAFQLGFIDTLLKSGKYEIDHIYGCSVGAIVAPFAIANKTKDAIDILKGIKGVEDVVVPWSPYNWTEKILSPMKTLLGQGAYQSFSLVDKAMASLKKSGAIQAGCFKKCECVAWDFFNKRDVWFTGSEYETGMHGSTSLWLAVPPLRYKDTFLVDGAFTEGVPVSKVLADKTQDFEGLYIVVFAGKMKSSPVKSLPVNALDVMYALQADTVSRLTEQEIVMMKSALGDQLCVIEPSYDPFINALDFDPKKITEYLQEGQRAFNKFVSK